MIAINPIPSPLGAEVLNLDLSNPVSQQEFGRIQDAFLRYAVLIFRNQDITPEQHIKFSRRFGLLAEHPIRSLWVKDHPELLRVPDKANYDERKNITAQIPWHTDLSYVERPSVAALLHGLEVPPPQEGGETGFIDTIAVYEALSHELKARIDKLQVIHRFDGREENQETNKRLGKLISSEDREQLKDVIHPLVTIHPEINKKNLNISCLYTYKVLGMSEHSSRELLDELSSFSTQDRFVYWHEWRQFNLVAWDNRRTMHTARGHTGKYPRVLQKTTIIGPYHSC